MENSFDISFSSVEPSFLLMVIILISIEAPVEHFLLEPSKCIEIAIFAFV